jgi:hypothetical protein
LKVGGRGRLGLAVAAHSVKRRTDYFLLASLSSATKKVEIGCDFRNLHVRRLRRVDERVADSSLLLLRQPESVIGSGA